MQLHLVFFLSALAFLSGIAYASLGLSLLYSLVPAAFLFAALFFCRVHFGISLFAALLLFAGSFYYFWDDGRYRALVSLLPQESEFKGVIVSDPKREADRQSFYLRTKAGKLLVRTDPLPEYFYGDAVTVSGPLRRPPPDSYGRFLAKERVVGSMEKPEIGRISSGNGSKTISFLLGAKSAIRGAYQKLLPPLPAAFLSGITLGVNEDFPEKFLQNLSISGTRHLTAVSGLHIAIIIMVVFNALLLALSRRYAFLLTFVFISFFVGLTGFHASAIRAALMGFLAALALLAGRQYAAYNALALAAVILAVLNPKVLVFDIGFQLSFLAVLGIVYFEPVLRGLLGLSDDEGLLKWKNYLMVTLSAQAATAPILIAQFQNFSLVAFAANVLVLSVIPVIMVLGFFMALLSFIFEPLAQVFGFAVEPLITYVVFIINLFAKYAVPFNPKLSVVAAAVYYAALIALIYWFYYRKKRYGKDPAVLARK